MRFLGAKSSQDWERERQEDQRVAEAKLREHQVGAIKWAMSCGSHCLKAHMWIVVEDGYIAWPLSRRECNFMYITGLVLDVTATSQHHLHSQCHEHDHAVFVSTHVRMLVAQSL